MTPAWWEKLRKKRSTNADEAHVLRPQFEFDDRGAPGQIPWRSGGWWLQAEPLAIQASIFATAKPVPAILSAWTCNTTSPSPVEERLSRGDERIGLLWDLARDMAGEFEFTVEPSRPRLYRAAA